MSADDQREQRAVLDLDALEELERVAELKGPRLSIKQLCWADGSEVSPEDVAYWMACVRALPDLIAAARERDQLRATGAVADAVARATPCTCSAQRIRAERAEAARTELLLSRAELADEVQRLRERVERHESGEVTAELRATVERVKAAVDTFCHGEPAYAEHLHYCTPILDALGDQP